MTLVIAVISLAIWLYSIFLRGRYWQIDAEGDLATAAPAAWPSIVAVIPARNEAGPIATSLTSLLHQDYAGRLSIILVDDSSDDGTAQIAESLPPSDPIHGLIARDLVKGPAMRGTFRFAPDYLRGAAAAVDRG